MIRRLILLAVGTLAAIPVAAQPAAGQAATARTETSSTAAVAAPASAVLPDTPAGRRAAELLRLSVDGDDASTRAFVEGNFTPRFRDAVPLEDHLRINARMRQESGGYDPLAVLVSEPAAIEVVVQARRTGARSVLSLQTEPDSPHRIDGVGVRPLTPADGIESPVVPDRPLTDAEIAATLGEYLDRLAEADAFSGVVLLARDSAVVLERAYGEASKSYGVPNDVRTKFNIGSMNKMFTAVAVAQLVEEGVLSWDDPIGKWIGPEWVRPEVGETVTIRHLLTHTSGLGSFFTEEFLRSSRGLYRGVDDWRDIVRADSLAFEPGAEWAYSNTGFHLLGVIVEKASGESYYDYVRERIYEPAGMTGTDAYEVDAVVPNLAQGYERLETETGVTYRSNVLEHTARGGPAGGGYSTAADLLAFARALADGRLLEAGSVEVITTPKPADRSPDYGYGFQQWEGGRVYGHTGGFPGISAALQIDRDTGDVLVVLSNYGRAARPVTDFARELLTAGGD
jgi:CubicO group peptidase (beta-lactamase class C family)